VVSPNSPENQFSLTSRGESTRIIASSDEDTIETNGPCRRLRPDRALATKIKGIPWAFTHNVDETSCFDNADERELKVLALAYCDDLGPRPRRLARETVCPSSVHRRGRLPLEAVRHRLACHSAERSGILRIRPPQCCSRVPRERIYEVLPLRAMGGDNILPGGRGAAQILLL
jgi:hypothetical protein